MIGFIVVIVVMATLGVLLMIVDLGWQFGSKLRRRWERRR